MARKKAKLKEYETSTVEYKEAKRQLPESVYKTISAFANTKGTGFQTQIFELKKYGLPEACWENDEKNDRFTIIFPYPEEQVTPQVTPQVELRDRIAKILTFCEEPRTLKEMMKFMELRDRKYFLYHILNPLLEKGHLKRTIQDKPKSRFQKYVTTREKKHDGK